MLLLMVLAVEKEGEYFDVINQLAILAIYKLQYETHLIHNYYSFAGRPDPGHSVF